MAKIGWISLHREIQQHWLWEDKPFSRGQAWIDLLLLANHKDNKFLLGNEVVEVKEGSFITSELKLMERWGWGKSKTRAFLDLLQADGMIVKKSDRKKTTINIVNYKLFQGLENESRPQTDHKQTANRPQADRKQTQTIMINNDNNENNDNKSLYVDDSELNAALVSFVEYRKKIKKPMTDRAVSLLISKLNKMSSSVPEQIEIIEQSIVNGWQGVFPLSKDKETKKGSQMRTYDIEAYNRMLNSTLPETVSDNEELKARAEKLKKEIAEKY
jgi:DNA replication protein DnaD